jgi:hypothetical protein
MATQDTEPAIILVQNSTDELPSTLTDNASTKILIRAQEIEGGQGMPIATNTSQFRNYGEIWSSREIRPHQRRRDSVTLRWVQIPNAEQLQEQIEAEIEEEERRDREALEPSGEDADAEDGCFCGYRSDFGDKCFCAIVTLVESAAEEVDKLREEIGCLLHDAGEISWRVVYQAERELGRAKNHHKALQREMEAWRAP